MAELSEIRNAFFSERTMNRMRFALGKFISDDAVDMEITSHASSFIDEIMKTMGDQRKDLTACSVDSLCQCMVDAARFGLQIDNRQLAHATKSNRKVNGQWESEAKLSIGYRGFLYALNDAFNGFSFSVTPVFADDEIDLSDENGRQTYSVKKHNVFENCWDKLDGVLFYMKYHVDENVIEKVYAMSKSDISKARAAAKTDNIWQNWPIEKAKAAAIKRGCKLEFSMCSHEAGRRISDMLDYDNSGYDKNELSKSKFDEDIEKHNEEIAKITQLLEESKNA